MAMENVCECEGQNPRKGGDDLPRSLQCFGLDCTVLDILRINLEVGDLGLVLGDLVLLGHVDHTLNLVPVPVEENLLVEEDGTANRANQMPGKGALWMLTPKGLTLSGIVAAHQFPSPPRKRPV